MKEKYFEIIDELLLRSDSALDKLSRVTQVHYRMNLRWRWSVKDPRLLPDWVVQYFTVAFLKKDLLSEKYSQREMALRWLTSARHWELEKAFTWLLAAVTDKCPTRCRRLTNELNNYFRQEGMKPIASVKWFIETLTSEYIERYDKKFQMPVRIYVDHKIRSWFKTIIREHKKKDEILDMYKIRNILHKGAK